MPSWITTFPLAQAGGISGGGRSVTLARSQTTRSRQVHAHGTAESVSVHVTTGTSRFRRGYLGQPYSCAVSDYARNASLLLRNAVFRQVGGGLLSAGGQLPDRRPSTRNPTLSISDGLNLTLIERVRVQCPPHVVPRGGVLAFECEYV
jgi:hypothetical protein